MAIASGSVALPARLPREMSRSDYSARPLVWYTDPVRTGWGWQSCRVAAPAQSLDLAQNNKYWSAFTLLEVHFVSRELIDHAELIQQRLLQLRDSL